MSRSINGQIIPSERANHFMMEHWNPLGIVGVISAFNFPCAVYGWNLALAMITGNMTIWKPAPSTPLIAIATYKIIQEVLERNQVPEGVVTLCCGGPDIGELMAKDTRVIIFIFGLINAGEIGVFHRINQNRQDRASQREQQIWKMHSRTGRQQCLHHNGGC